MVPPNIVISKPTLKISEFFLALYRVYLATVKGLALDRTYIWVAGGGEGGTPSKCLLLLSFLFCSLGCQSNDASNLARLLLGSVSAWND